MITSAVRIENLTKKFDDTFAIKEMSLNIAKGKITALTGEDAAGKTTLIRLITGLLKPSCGKIQTLGLDPFIQKSVLNSKIGYMPQKFGLYEDLTVIENLMLYADLKGINVKPQFSPLALRKDDNTLNKMLAFTRLTQFQNRLAGKLSGGMKQKLGLACALLGKPEFLILDEPSVGVDPVSRLDLMKMVKASMSANMTVLWSTSYLEEARSFDEAIVLHQGKVIFKGKPKEIGEYIRDKLGVTEAPLI